MTSGLHFPTIWILWLASARFEYPTRPQAKGRPGPRHYPLLVLVLADFGLLTPERRWYIGAFLSCRPQQAPGPPVLTIRARMTTEAAEKRPLVGLFVTCLVDLFRPSVGFAAIKLLEDAGARVEVPESQTCCGQPAYNSGDRADAKAIARGRDREFRTLRLCGGAIGVLRRDAAGALPEPARRRSALRGKSTRTRRQELRAHEFPRRGAWRSTRLPRGSTETSPITIPARACAS